jgi:hypothetical protein
MALCAKEKLGAAWWRSFGTAHPISTLYQDHGGIVATLYEHFTGTSSVVY